MLFHILTQLRQISQVLEQLFIGLRRGSLLLLFLRAKAHIGELVPIVVSGWWRLKGHNAISSA